MWIYLIVYFSVSGSNVTPESCRQFTERDRAIFWITLDQSEFRQSKRPYIAKLDSVWVDKSMKSGDTINLSKKHLTVRVNNNATYMFISRKGKR